MEMLVMTIHRSRRHFFRDLFTGLLGFWAARSVTAASPTVTPPLSNPLPAAWSSPTVPLLYRSLSHCTTYVYDGAANRYRPVEGNAVGSSPHVTTWPAGPGA
jgi:hypothetical protein